MPFRRIGNPLEPGIRRMRWLPRLTSKNGQGLMRVIGHLLESPAVQAERTC